MNHKLDTDKQVFFYEQDFYVLSNFSAFSIKWQGRRFPTSEHAYHWEKFAPGTQDEHGLFVRARILEAYSAHDAFTLAEGWQPRGGKSWLGRLWMDVREELRAEDADARNEELAARAAWGLTWR